MYEPGRTRFTRANFANQPSFEKFKALMAFNHKKANIVKIRAKRATATIEKLKEEIVNLKKQIKEIRIEDFMEVRLNINAFFTEK